MHTAKQIMRAAHNFARAYALASFTLGDPSISREEFERRGNRAMSTYHKVVAMIADAVDASEHADTRDAVAAGIELQAYATLRQENNDGTESSVMFRAIIEDILHRDVIEGLRA